MCKKVIGLGTEAIDDKAVKEDSNLMRASVVKSYRTGNLTKVEAALINRNSRM